MAQLFVGQLPFNKFYPEDLERIFSPYGVVIGRELYIRKGNGFVLYRTTEEADAAIAGLHGRYVVEGGRHQPIQVMYSKGTKLISPFGLRHRAQCMMVRESRADTSKDGQVIASTASPRTGSGSPEGGPPRTTASLPSSPHSSSVASPQQQQQQQQQHAQMLMSSQPQQPRMPEFMTYTGGPPASGMVSTQAAPLFHTNVSASLAGHPAAAAAAAPVLCGPAVVHAGSRAAVQLPSGRDNNNNNNTGSSLISPGWSRQIGGMENSGSLRTVFPQQASPPMLATHHAPPAPFIPLATNAVPQGVAPPAGAMYQQILMPSPYVQRSPQPPQQQQQQQQQTQQQQQQPCLVQYIVYPHGPVPPPTMMNAAMIAAPSSTNHAAANAGVPPPSPGVWFVSSSSAGNNPTAIHPNSYSSNSNHPNKTASLNSQSYLSQSHAQMQHSGGLSSTLEVPNTDESSASRNASMLSTHANWMVPPQDQTQSKYH